jgi:WD40 repeat protein
MHPVSRLPVPEPAVNGALPRGPAGARFYIAGGTLRADAVCYVIREADERLFQSLREGHFSYVLTSRQMGKSSLMVRAAARLKECAIAVAIADLSAIGQNLSADQWYYGLAERIGGQLGFKDARIEEIWSRNPHHPPVRRWTMFIDELLRENPRDRLVVFVDEIDTVRSLSFSTDEFFASIRSFYNSRTIQPEYDCLTFCLLGVAAPAEIIRDPLTTPFNIGSRIELNDFADAEAAPLAEGLGGEVTGMKRLSHVLHWTGGHPYLTQRLCQAVAAAADSANSVDDICKAVFLGSRARASDENLAFVREYLLHTDVDTAALLKLYGQIRVGRSIADSETDRLTEVLRLSGLCRVRDGRLRLRNRIYARVFDHRWIRMSMPDAERRRQRAAFQRGFTLATVGAAIVLALVAFLTYDVFQERNRNQYRLYIANVGLASQAWENHDPARSIELLRSAIPRPSQRDLRGLEWYCLWNLTHAEHPLVSIREGMLRNPIISRDGRQVFAAGPDAVVEFDAQSGRLVRRLFALPHDSYPTLRISPDGRTLVARGLAKFTTVDLDGGGVFQAEGKPQDSPIPAELLVHLDPALAPHCTWIVFWPPSALRLLSARSESGLIRCASLSPDQQYSAVTTRNAVEIWSVALARRIVSIPTNQPGPVAFSADSRYFAWGEYGPIHILDIRANHVSDLPGHRGLVNSVVFSPDGRWVASAGQDEVRIWDLRSGRPTRLFGRYAGNPTVAFFPDGSKLLVGGRLGIDIWDLQQRQPEMVGSDEIYALAFSPSRAIFAAGGNDGQLTLWDAVAHERKGVLHIGERIDYLSFLDARSVVVNTPHRVEVWDLVEGHSQSVLADSPSRVLAALALDRKTVAIADSSTRELKLVDVATRRAEYRRLLDSAPGALAFAADSRTLAVSLADQRVEVLSGSVFRELRGSGFGRALAFSPDTRQLLVGYDEAQIGIWDWRRQRMVGVLEGHTAPIKSIQFSPDGTRVISASDDGAVRIWDATTYEALVAFRESDRSMETVAFSPDSRFWAAAGDDRHIRLWDARREAAR